MAPEPILSERPMERAGPNGSARSAKTASFDASTCSGAPASSAPDSFELTLIDPNSTDVRGSFTDPRRSSGSQGKASLFSSCVNLANSVLGTGLLALPRAFAHAGWGWGLAFSTLSAVLNILTSVYISETCRKTRPPASFTAIADAALPRYSIVVNLGLILMSLGACCSYIIVATSGFHTVANAGGSSWYWTVLALCVVAPLSFLRSMDALRFTSLAAVVIVLFLTTIIFIYSLGANDDGLLDPCAGVRWNATYFVDDGPCPPGPFEIAGSTWGVFSAFSSLSMAFGEPRARPAPSAPRVRAPCRSSPKLSRATESREHSFRQVPSCPSPPSTTRWRTRRSSACSSSMSLAMDSRGSSTACAPCADTALTGMPSPQTSSTATPTTGWSPRAGSASRSWSSSPSPSLQWRSASPPS
eukprot:7108710-Prymnesium_polylepis.1